MTLAWPKGDTELRKVAFDVTILEMALPHCKQRRNCIQAGGAAGTFPLWLSDHFEKVFTFEPDPLNFSCLARNCERKNIIKFQAALGQGAQSVGMSNDRPGNAGAGFIGHGSDIQMLAADYLNIRCVDLIQLDVEGYEYFALQGLTQTIGRSSPVVVVEKKHAERHGIQTAAAGLFLESMGYSQVGAYARDLIFARA